MLSKSDAKDLLTCGFALTLVSTALLCTLGSAAAAQQQPSALAGNAPQRVQYPTEVVVSESYRFFAGGRELPVTGDTASLMSRLSVPTTAMRDLGLALTPGLEIGPGHTVQLFGTPPLPRAGLAQPATARLITLHPVAYRGAPLAAGSDVMSIATATGKLLVVRERNLPQTVDGSTPTADRDTARRVALEAGRTHGMPAGAEASEPRLEVFVDRSAKGRLAWRVRVSSASLVAPWARDIWVAAIANPVVLADREVIYHGHNGHVAATAFPASPLGGTVSLDLDAAFVNRTGSDGGQVTTGPDGRYAFPTGSGSATDAVGVSGPTSNVDNVAGSEISASATGSDTAPIDLSLNASTPEELAQTTAFVFVNRAHALVQDFLPPAALARLPTRVNINDTCNAFWDGSSLNLFRAGNGCVNTAYADVVLHEYGHGVDDTLGGILDGGYSEGFGDALALIGTRQPCVGRDLFGAGTCLRPATDVVLWPPDTDEVHEVGRRYAGFVWELITNLQAVYAPEAAFEVARQLVLGAAAANPANIPDAVRLSFIVDDDDGDLTTCSLHFRILAAAADSRQIPRPPDCVHSRQHVRLLSDVDKDGKADIVGFGDAGVWTALSAGGGGFASEKFVLAEFGANQGWEPSKHVRLLADINNDGKPDIVGFGDAGVWTALSTGDGGFAPAKFVLAEFGANHAWSSLKHVRLLADINNDGKPDIVGFGDAGVWTALSTGDGGFAPAKFVLAEFGANQGWAPSKHVRILADINNDGKPDIVGFGDAGVWTALSTGDGGFAPAKFVLANFGANQAWTPFKHLRLLADINNDGKPDIVGFGDAGVWTSLSTGDGGFAPAKFVLANFGANQGWTPFKHVRLLADINNDSKADIVGFGDAGVWTALSTGDGGFAPEKFVLANFGANQAWTTLKHVRVLAELNNDRKVVIVGFGDAGVWTALSTGDGGFDPEKFVLANFGFNQAWRPDTLLGE
jgi:FG-GAP-like repeat